MTHPAAPGQHSSARAGTSLGRLLGAQDVRRLADQLGVSPTKKWGQNFVIDPNTVRRIVEAGHVSRDDVVLEVGPGLGSLTMALLERAGTVVCIEIDARLADALPQTVAEFMHEEAQRLFVINDDAMNVVDMPQVPTRLIANLPYNVSVPVVLHLLAAFPTIAEVLVMVQAEVADRLAASPGSRTYGVPSVKARWYGDVARAGNVPRSIFWPVPNVDSGLVRITRAHVPGDEALRSEVFALVDAAFGQRRKALRSALGSALGDRVDAVLDRAGIDRLARGEQLSVADFVVLATAARQVQ